MESKEELLKEVWNTNLIVDETIRLLTSLLQEGESTDSNFPQSMVKISLEELNKQRECVRKELNF